MKDAQRQTEHRGDGPAVAHKALRLIRQEQLFPEGSRALVMVSGGQDSVALLHFLSTGEAGKYGPASLHALHINHHLRGEESNADQLLVENLCARLGVPLTVEHCHVDKSQGNVQEAARILRRRAALAVATRLGCDRIALGHTADDLVETMLYRLGRYGGLAAFAPMAAVDPPWVRPLLTCRRSETAAYCAFLGLDYAHDRGNVYPGYARTGIRERVLPAWEDVLPGAVEGAARAAEVAGEFRVVADWVVAEVLSLVAPDVADNDSKSVAVGDQLRNVTVVNAVALQALPSPVRRLFLHAWLAARGRLVGSRAAVIAVESILGTGGTKEISLPAGWRVCKEYGWLSIEQRGRGPRESERLAPPPAELCIPGSVCWGEVEIRAEYVEEFLAPDVACETYLDASCLASPVTVRGPLPGDRLRPLGAPGVRKLQDILVDLKVPKRLRSLVPVVVSGGQIVWVAGLVSAEEGRITADTKSIVRLSMSRMSRQTETEKEAIRTNLSVRSG
ncbi:MAG: tRNA lysidine(34) synthetase TilS [Thermoleophilia bacterium]|nr:tRNA lysidine(34) synthetase TilS [Thermoleophilia bacterium]